jgi:hypothetical protein
VSPLVDAKELAAYLSVDVSWVYANAGLLKARRLGAGPNARLRFSLEDADAALLTTDCSTSRQSRTTKPSRRDFCPAGVELLPIRPIGASR